MRKPPSTWSAPSSLAAGSKPPLLLSISYSVVTMRPIAVLLLIAQLGLAAACSSGITAHNEAGQATSTATTIRNEVSIGPTDPPTSTTLEPTTTSTTIAPTTTTIAPSALVLESANAFIAALQSGDLAAVRAVSSPRCGGKITSKMLHAMSRLFSTASMTTSLVSVEGSTAKVLFSLRGKPLNPRGSTFNLLDGQWRFDACR